MEHYTHISARQKNTGDPATSLTIALFGVSLVRYAILAVSRYYKSSDRTLKLS
ncbi:MAG: hypothetical protein RMY28_007855 [Nostoc sp. ChiSLP01]|nr:hypothetical protein [Nostoc sp. CmiSLP01]MDZ8286077.1 hypothetical protein [Nostoc sp. ChiSLP01]